MREHRNPDIIHKPVAGYVHQIELSNIKRQLILSGQIGMDLSGNIPEGINEQFEITLDNIVKNLISADMKIQNIDKLTIYLAEEMDAGKRKEILEKKLGSYKPCMTLIYVKSLASPKIKVEIDTMASSD